MEELVDQILGQPSGIIPLKRLHLILLAGSTSSSFLTWLLFVILQSDLINEDAVARLNLALELDQQTAVVGAARPSTHRLE